MAFIQNSVSYQSTTGGSDTPDRADTIRLKTATSVDDPLSKKPGRQSSASKDARRGATPEIRTKIRSKWRAACGAVEGLLKSANADHAECLFFAIELKERLAELWALREYREEDWVGILDRAQVALAQLDDQTIECIEANKASTIRELVVHYLSPSTKSEHDLREAVRLVSELDVPPFGDMSALAQID